MFITQRNYPSNPQARFSIEIARSMLRKFNLLNHYVSLNIQVNLLFVMTILFLFIIIDLN